MMTRDWRTRALCRDQTKYDPEMWFPATDYDNEALFNKQAAEALKVCAACPVQRECLEHWLNRGGVRGDQFAVVGGTTPKQRARLRKRPPARRLVTA